MIAAVVVITDKCQCVIVVFVHVFSALTSYYPAQNTLEITVKDLWSAPALISALHPIF